MRCMGTVLSLELFCKSKTIIKTLLKFKKNNCRAYCFTELLRGLTKERETLPFTKFLWETNYF